MGSQNETPPNRLTSGLVYHVHIWSEEVKPLYRYVDVSDPLIEEAGARQGHDLNIAALFAAMIHGLDEQWVETVYVSRTTLRKWAVGHMETLLSLTLNQGNALRTFRRPDIIAAVYDISDSNENTVFYIAAETSHSGRGEGHRQGYRQCEDYQGGYGSRSLSRGCHGQTAPVEGRGSTVQALRGRRSVRRGK